MALLGPPGHTVLRSSLVCLSPCPRQSLGLSPLSVPQISLEYALPWKMLHKCYRMAFIQSMNKEEMNGWCAMTEFRVQKYLQSITSALYVCGIVYWHWFPSRFNLPVLAPAWVPPQIFLASSVPGSGRAQISTILPSKAMLGFPSPLLDSNEVCPAGCGIWLPHLLQKGPADTPQLRGEVGSPRGELWLMGNKKQPGAGKFMPSSHATSSDGSFWGSAVPNRLFGEVLGDRARSCDSCEATASPTPYTSAFIASFLVFPVTSLGFLQSPGIEA